MGPMAEKKGVVRPMATKLVDSARPRFQLASSGVYGGVETGCWLYLRPSGASSAAVHTWSMADEANFVKCASGTGRVKRATMVEGAEGVGPVRTLPWRNGESYSGKYGIEPVSGNGG